MKKQKVILIFALAVLSLFFLFLDKQTNFYVISGSPANLEVELPSTYSTVNPGEEIWFTVKLLNLAELGRRDVTLRYEIVDDKGNEIASKSETVAVETQASFVNSLIIPVETEPGQYILKAYLISDGIENSETEVSFSVLEEVRDTSQVFYLVIVVLVLVFLIFLLFKGRYFIERVKLKSKIKSIVRKRLKDQG